MNVYRFLSSLYPKKNEITQRKNVKFIPLRGINTAIFIRQSKINELIIQNCLIKNPGFYTNLC